MQNQKQNELYLSEIHQNVIEKREIDDILK
jgi:hypothetical protein